MKVSEFINNEFREYANYDNYRSLPHIMDGLKVTQRKVLDVFIEHIGTGKIVVDKAGMRAADLSKYHHGATSMIGVLVGMNQDFPGANNLPLFEKHGQFGTRLNHKASSERYISTKLNDTYKKLFESDDEPILQRLFDDGDRIEPKFFLPKLPLLLINGSSGTGNGYSSNVLSYEVNELKQAVLEVLKTGQVQTKLTPFLNGYEGGISKDHVTGQVTFEGTIERKNSTTLILTELTPNRQLASYKELLNGLMNDKTGKNKDEPPYIKDYDNESTEEGWRFVIDCPRTTTAMSDEDLMKMFKLVSRDTENLTVWMPNGKLKKFATVEQLIEAWVDLRLGFYEERRLNKIERLDEQILWLKTKAIFIDWWNRNPAQWVKLKRAELEKQMFVSVTMNDEFINRLLQIRVSNLAIDEIEELDKEIAKLEAVKATYVATTNKKMMDKEVKEIKL